MPDVLTKPRFVAGKCVCIRTAGRKFGECWIHNGFREYLKSYLIQSGLWHTNVVPGTCTCTDAKAVKLKTASFGDASDALSCGGMVREIVLNEALGLSLKTWLYPCVIDDCAECTGRFLECPVDWDTAETCTWRAYKYVIKLRKGEVLDAKTGLLENGKRPRKAKELVDTRGTRYQFMSAFRDHWLIYKSHEYETRWDRAYGDGIYRTLRREDLMISADFSAHPELRATRELTCQQGNRKSLYTAIVTFGVQFCRRGYATEWYSISVLFWSDDNVQVNAPR